MEQIIRQLNRMNYVTLSCCGGHLESAILHIYIQFKNHYDFKILPKGFKTHIYDGKTVIEYLNVKSFNNHRKITIDKHIQELKRWINELKQI
jgi:hypothetical protein